MTAALRSAGYVLNGILNGIDMSVWNPEADTFIEHNYSLGNYSSGKAANKLALQKELGLPERDVSGRIEETLIYCDTVVLTHLPCAWPASRSVLCGARICCEVRSQPPMCYCRC